MLTQPRISEPVSSILAFSALIGLLFVIGCGGSYTSSTSSAPVTYSVSGTVTGLAGSGLVLQDNAGNNLPVGANGSFMFTAPVASSSTYNVSVLTQPSSPTQTCVVTNGSGTTTANVTSVQVSCTTNTYSIGGTVSGLTGTGLVLQDNGGNNLSVNAGATTFSFTAAIASGSAYSITVTVQPSSPTQTCMVTSGSGPVTSANVTSVQVTCTTNTYSIGGSVSGLTGAGLVLQDNGGNNLSVNAGATTFTFTADITSGGSYNAKVLTQPSSPTQTCAVTTGSGTVTNVDITNIQVTCTTNTYSVGGTVSGLAGSGLVLQDNSGNNLAVSASGSFTFSTPLASGATYNVTVFSQPTNPSEACVPTLNTGTITSSNVSNVSVVCTTDTFTVGGTVSGLASGQGLALVINGGSSKTVSANGSFTFNSTLASGVNYTVWIGAQPNLQQCAVANNNGTVSNASVTDVNVTCNPTSPSSGPFAKVQSFEYLIGTTLTTPNIYPEISSSSADMIFLGGGFIDGPLNRTAADPSASKLIFAYVDVAEASAFLYPNLLSGPLPTWFGKPNLAYTNLYTVQYWNPAWQTILYSDIDQIIANGYDGVFLDVLNGDTEWAAGNVEGNPVYADATQAMAQLMTNIRTYISTKYPSKQFYVIGNGPTNEAVQYPSALNSLDGILNETIYWQQPSTAGMGLTSGYIGTTWATYVMNVIAPIYKSSGVPVIGNDYPNPTSNLSAVFPSFNFYNSLGWVPSVQNATTDATILSTGPFLFTATPANPNVTGHPNFVNFITGGSAPNATLVGGNQGDYFIGGPGQNTITAGSGVNTIYAHPQSAVDKNKLVIDLSSQINGTATTPSATIAVNGKTVVPLTPITAVYLTNTQEFVIDTTNMTPITSVVITGSNATYMDANNNSTSELMHISYNGQPIALSSGVYADFSGYGYASYFLSNGTATFASSLFPANAPFLFDTSDIINGGSGTNTVIYRGPYSNYTVVKQANGSYLVTSQSTAEGPDTLTNIQTLQFSDQSVNLN